jgi:glycosyltransferase involved in cell wall biosynthesis
VVSERATVTPLRVLHVYRTYFPDPPGGLQEAIRQICLATSAHGVQSTIFALSPLPVPAELERPEGRVIRGRSLMAPASCDLGGPGAFSRFLELTREADLINYHFPWPFADLMHFAVRPRTPAVLTYHSDIVRQRWQARLYAPMMHRMLRSMAAIVATSPIYARTSRILTKPDWRDSVKVIPLGIDEHSYPATADDCVLESLGLERDQPFFLFIGMLRYYKALRVLIEAAKSVGAPVVIAGSGPEGADLRARARAARLENVRFAGQVTDAEKVSLLKHCRALVLPSHLRSEAYGMVLVEAAMYGRPMITCEIGTGTSYVNAHRETGIVVAPQCPDALAAAMNRLLEDPALARCYGTAARRRFERKFSGRALGSAYADLYRHTMAHCPSALRPERAEPDRIGLSEPPL